MMKGYFELTYSKDLIKDNVFEVEKEDGIIIRVANPHEELKNKEIRQMFEKEIFGVINFFIAFSFPCNLCIK